MDNPTSPEAQALIVLAARMGIPTDVAVRAVLEHLTYRDRAEDDVDPRSLLVRRMTA